MALFSKKKLSLDEILKGLESLSEEEKAQVKAKMDDLYKAEDEREIDKIEEDKASDSEEKDEKAEEVAEESEEIGKDVDSVEDTVEDEMPTPIEIKDDDGIEEVNTTESDAVEEQAEEGATAEATESVDNATSDDATQVEVVDDKEEEKEEVGERLAERVSGLEKELAEYKSFIAELRPLLDLAQEFTTKQAKSFGYTGNVPGVNKDVKDMDVAELQRTLASEI